MLKVFAFALLLAIFVSIDCEPIESNFYREESCTAKKGFCVLEKECPSLVTDELKGLCPMQKNQGAICCQGLSHDDVNCAQLHNVCRPNNKCPKSLQLGRKGCPNNSVCCVLV